MTIIFGNKNINFSNRLKSKALMILKASLHSGGGPSRLIGVWGYECVCDLNSNRTDQTLNVIKNTNSAQVLITDVMTLHQSP